MKWNFRMTNKIQYFKCKIILALLFTLFFVWLDGSDAVEIKAASCQQTDVQAAIDSAKPGDTVRVPAGNCEWNSPIIIKQAITLVGQTSCIPNGKPGDTKYKISCDGATRIAATQGSNIYLITIAPLFPADNPRIDIGGFTLDGGGTDGKGGGIFIQNNSTSPISNIHIHNNEILNNFSMPGIYIQGYVYGLISRNYFHNIGNGTYRTYLFRYDGNCYAWAAAYPNYGTADFLYFEDNYTEAIGYILCDSGTGARWVWRYNTMNIDASVPQKMFDLHEDVSNCGGIAAEVYENTAVGTTTSWARFAQMGMNQIMYNNKTGCVANSCEIQLGFAGQTGCTNYANIDYQAHVKNTYLWNNTYAGSGYPVAVGEADAPDCFVEDKDYWDDSDGYNGESPFSSDPRGYGNMFYDLSSKRPNLCADNDVYWETELKRLYHCKGTNNWVLVYTPYGYPHPLSGEDPGGGILPAAPGGLTVK